MPICAFSFYTYICISSCHVINDNLSICCPPFSFWFTYKQVLSTTSLYKLDSRCRPICIIYAQFYLWFLDLSFFSYMDFNFRREIPIYCIIVLVIWKIIVYQLKGYVNTEQVKTGTHIKLSLVIGAWHNSPSALQCFNFYTTYGDTWRGRMQLTE